VHDRPVATGYNGPAAGQPHCLITDNTCPLDVAKAEGRSKDWEVCPAVHAEVNAIVTAAIAGIKIEGGTLYITKKPCAPCWRMLSNCRLKAVEWSED